MPVVNQLPTQGGMKATLLWTNPNPTSAYEKGSISLAEPLTNFQKLRIVWAYSIYDSDASKVSAVDYEIGDISNWTNASWKLNFGMDCSTNSGTWFGRGAFINDTTTYQSVWMRECWREGYSGTDNNRLIPLEIYGLNGDKTLD